MRQYIGARYVPMIFQNPDDATNNWKANYAYEPLTIVSYANASYTSKKAVPASIGNPASNPDYWVAIGLYSGQTSANTTAIHKIRESLTNAIEDGNTATQNYSTDSFLWFNGSLCRVIAPIASGDALVIGSNIELYTMLPIQLDDLPNDFSRKSFFKNKKILIAGDSLSDETVFPPNWVANLRTLLSDTNTTIYNKSVAGIMASGNGGMHSLFTNFAETDIDIVIIEVGTNDCNAQQLIGRTTQSTDTFMGALKSIANSIVSKWPSAQVFYIMPPKCSLTPQSSVISEQIIPRCIYRFAAQVCCNTFNWNIIDCATGLPQLDMTNATIINRYTDGIHPNASYAPIMMNYIVNQIISGGVTSIGLESTSWSIQNKNMFSENVTNGNGYFKFCSDGTILINISCRITTAGDKVFLTNIPTRLLDLFFSNRVVPYGASVNNNASSWTMYNNEFRVPVAQDDSQMILNYLINLKDNLIPATDVSI